MSELEELAKDYGFLEQEDSVAMRKIFDAIDALSEKDSDSGFSLEGFDIWATIGGKEYFITVKQSLAQKNKDHKIN